MAVGAWCGLLWLDVTSHVQPGVEKDLFSGVSRQEKIQR